MKAFAAALILFAPLAASAAVPHGPSAADVSSCYALRAEDDRLRTAFAKGSPFPDQVHGAFQGEGVGDATAGDYLTRGQDLFALTDTVVAQCAATFGPGSGPVQEVVAAPIRRRVAEAKHTAQLYLDLPRTIASIDAEESPAGLALRGEFLTAMYKIAAGGDYGAASALADDAHAKLARNRR